MSVDASTLPLSLIVFAYNEEDNVPSVLGEILRWLRARGPNHELIFVNDGSTDNTLTQALAVMGDDPRCKLIDHASRRGIGAAIKSGVAAASQTWVTFLPCDGQIPVEGIDTLCASAASSSVPVVFSVYRNRDDGLRRKVLSLGVRGLILGVHGQWLQSDGPYLFQRTLFDPYKLKPDSFFLNFEFPIRVLRQGIGHRVVTIECVPRRFGSSKSSGLRQVGIIARDLLELRVRLWLE